jgi:hypothetical protein
MSGNILNWYRLGRQKGLPRATAACAIRRMDFCMTLK